MAEGSWVVVGPHVLIPGVGSLHWIMEDGYELGPGQKTEGSATTYMHINSDHSLGFTLSLNGLLLNVEPIFISFPSVQFYVLVHAPT